MKRIVILGSTGSIGQNALDVVSRHRDRFEIVGLGARTSVDLLAGQCRDHPGAMAAMTDPASMKELAARGLATTIDAGDDAFIALIEETKPDLVVNAVVGFAGLRPTMTALEAGISVAIANKETVVAGGEIVIAAAQESGAKLIPIDSEHVAISQCLRGESIDDVARVMLTASGGALRDRDPATFVDVTVEDVLAHPTWDMGAKVTVDSATLVNKGLEVIEAHWLFGLPYEKIDVVVHPQSIAHSFVEFVDGSITSQMGQPDMRLPILYALSYPERAPSSIRDDVAAFPTLTFEPVDDRRYPCFRLVLAAAQAGGSTPTVLNAANEVAVDAFLRGAIPFTGIRELIERVLDGVERIELQSLDDIIETDRAARAWIREQFPAARVRA